MSLKPAQGNLAGQIEPKGEVRTESKILAVNNEAFVRGDVLKVQAAGTFHKAAAAELGPFAVCIKDKATTVTRVEYVDQEGVEVSVVADGAIKPEAFVKAGTAAGRVQAWVSGTDGGGLRVGRYIKRAQYVGEGDGVTPTADAAQGDIIIIRLLGE